MTTFPKYMIKRLIPEDGVKLVGDEIQVTINNVLATIPFDKMPDNFLKALVVKVDNDIIASGDKPDLINKAKLTVRGTSYPFSKIKAIDGGALAPGESMTLVLPNAKNFKKGEIHSFEASMLYRPKKDDPLVIAFERKIN